MSYELRHDETDQHQQERILIGCQRGRDESREGGDAPGRRDRQPCCEYEQTDRPGECERDAEKGRDTLAAPEA